MDTKLIKLINEQARKFAAAHTSNGIIYFKMIGDMIRDKEVMPPKGMERKHLEEAYDQAVKLVAKKEYEKSAKKNR